MRLSAYLGHDQNDVIKSLIKNFGLDHVEATRLVTRVYALRQAIDDQDAADAEFDTE